MLLTTIQAKEVYTMINTKGIIWPNKQALKYKKRHIKKAYNRISKYARKITKKRYKLYPFWCTYTNIGINNIEESQIKLTLDVPDDFVLLSNYDKWIEYLDTSESDSSTQCWKGYSKLLFDVSSCKRIQAIIPFIKKEWIIATECKLI